MKKLSTLLRQREALLRQARLANLASAYQALNAIAERVARSELKGRVKLAHSDPDDERYWPSLVAIDFSQSVIEEHFTDEDIYEFADVLAFTTGDDDLELEFPLEEIDDLFVAPIRAELEREGIAIDTAPVPAPKAHDG